MNADLNTQPHGEVLATSGLFCFTSVLLKSGSIITLTYFLSFVALSTFFFSQSFLIPFLHTVYTFSLDKLYAVFNGSHRFNISYECQVFKPSFLLKRRKFEKKSFIFVFTKFYIIQYSSHSR